MPYQKIAPAYIIPETAAVLNFGAGNLVEIYKSKEGELPEFLRFSSVNCPPGFEFLLEAKGVILQQVIQCCGLCKTYDILSLKGEKFLDGARSYCECGFAMVGKKDKEQMLYTKRACVPSECCDKGMRVEAPTGNLLGYVAVRLDKECCPKCECCGPCVCCKCDTKCECCVCTGVITAPIFLIMDPARQIVMTINIEVKVICPHCAECCGRLCTPRCLPCATCRGCCEDMVYILRANDEEYIGAGTVLGEIRRKYPGFCCPDPPRYELTFPEDLEIRMKVVVMSSVFLMHRMGF